MIYYFCIYFFIYLLYRYYSNEGLIWNMIKLYSHIEIFYKDLKKYVIYLFADNNNEYAFIVILDGNEILSLSYNDFFISKKMLKNMNYDMILYYQKIIVNNKNKYNLIRFLNENEIENTIDDKHFDKSIKILNPIVKIDGLTFQIKVKIFNIYLSNNILFDKIFLKWYLKKYENFNLRNDDEYNVLFLNEKMKLEILNKEHSLIVKKDKYEIINI